MVTGATGSEPVDGPNHRGFDHPAAEASGRALQLALLSSARAPVDGFLGLGRGEWLSLVTLTPDGSDRWSRVVI